MRIDGAILIGGEDRQGGNRFEAVDAATGEPVGPGFSEASAADVADACALAAAASEACNLLAPQDRAAFLETVGEEVAAIGEPLITTAMAETGLPRARIEGERARTINQLRMFAEAVRARDWQDVVIEPALPERSPPRPDLRRMNVALGPVAVFGASNFPLAFSVAGGDTASALAAGCPVVVRGHPAHPGTGELVARAVRRAVDRSALPSGTFSFLPGRSHDVGTALVSDPRIMAVGFTGSRQGGLAIQGAAQRRPVPIPVYAEMSSINPVILLPHALEARAEALSEAFVASLTLGAGQFCTNPGLVLAVGGDAFDRFVNSAVEALARTEPAVMLTADIRDAFLQGTELFAGYPEVSRLGGPMETEGGRCRGALFTTTAEAFRMRSALHEECFGASSLIVRCRDHRELVTVIDTLEGQLTMTLHLDPPDQEAAREIIPRLRQLAGRIIANGWPTGVEVSAAMVHGGPYPATTVSSTTSVGTLAMRRFLRPVCFQDMPEGLLPLSLRASNAMK